MPKKIKVSLTVTEGQDKGKVYSLTKPKAIIGRMFGDLTLTDAKISRKHAVIEIVDGKVFIRDMGSTNGILLNDTKVEDAELRNMDEITLGFTKIQVAVLEDLKEFREKNIPRSSGKEEKISKEESENLDIGSMIEEELARFSRWDVSSSNESEKSDAKYVTKAIAFLEVTDGPDKGKKIKLKKGNMYIGRGKSDINLKDTDVSRSHCQIEVHSKRQIVLKDLKSTNGTYVNGKKITQISLSSGDVIQIGGTMMEFILAQ